MALDFRVMINGIDALEHSFQASTTYTVSEMAFEEMAACVEMGLPYSDYVKLPGSLMWLGVDTPLCKCDVIMWYRYQKMVPAALDDIASRRNRIK